MKIRTLAFLTAAAASTAGAVHADMLDDVIASGTLRCGVVLDFPPMGMRDAQNNPIGFDVDYCNDLAASLGVDAEIVETPFPERIPALMAGRIDVGVSSTSDTLQRAQTVGFSIPYHAFEAVVIANESTEISDWQQLEGLTVGATAGNFEAIWLEKQVQDWGAGEFRPYQTQADVFLALSQGQIAATVTYMETAEASISSGNYPGIHIVGAAPMVSDYVALFTQRDEQGFLNYLDLFINQQVRTGRYAELYAKWIGEREPAILTVSGAYR